MSGWQTLRTRVAYENPFMIVHEDQAINPAGKEVIYGYIDSKSDSVYVVPIDHEGNTYIVNQYRYTIKQDTWECVAGRVDNDGVHAAAKRELLEETGLAAQELILIGTVQVANGMTTFKSHFFIAKNLQKITEKLDEHDGILGAKKLPLKNVVDMILKGDIQCSQSIAAFLMAHTYLQRKVNEL
jgi:ADP-ribose pyrophosphatase